MRTRPRTVHGIARPPGVLTALCVLALTALVVPPPAVARPPAPGAQSVREPTPSLAAVLVTYLVPQVVPDPGLAGRLVLGSMPGTGLDGATRALIRTQHLGGIVYFGRNVVSTQQVGALSRSLHAAAEGQGFLVTVDQEGGVVRRLRPTGPVLSAHDAGRRGASYVRGIMTAAGRDLARLDIDVDLAPVADLDVGGGFIGSRSYGSDWRRVRDDVVAAVGGLQSAGTLAAVKHFPGLGGVLTNTDLGTGVAPRIRGTQLEPFRAAVAAGAAMVMVGNATHPGLGRGPASLQHQSYELLRRLGFTGVAVTDDLAARALSARGAERAAVDAVRAGADLVIVTGSPQRIRSVVLALQRAVARGVIPARRWQEALARVLELQARARN
jgi:beta-N-acetylhexosaminidase